MSEELERVVRKEELIDKVKEWANEILQYDAENKIDRFDIFESEVNSEIKIIRVFSPVGQILCFRVRPYSVDEFCVELLYNSWKFMSIKIPEWVRKIYDEAEELAIKSFYRPSGSEDDYPIDDVSIFVDSNGHSAIFRFMSVLGQEIYILAGFFAGKLEFHILYNSWDSDWGREIIKDLEEMYKDDPE